MVAKKRGAKARPKTGVTDTMRNLVSNLGTDRDKATFNRFVVPTMVDRAQLEAAYRTDWIARKSIDIPAQDATREWRTWNAKDKQVEAIEALEKRHGIQRKVMLTLQRARLYGGACLVLGINDGQKADQELKLDRVKKDKLDFVHSLARQDITAGDVNLDVLSPFHGEPAYYEVRSNNGTVRIHPSRVLRFIGRELPSIEAKAGEPWGDSFMLALDDAIKGASSGMAATSALVQEAKIDVIKIPGLTQGMGTDDFSNRLLTRFQLANVAKSLVNTLIIDGEEEWDRIEQVFTGLPDVIRLFLLVASGAADIPATRLLGQSPAGLSSTGESDLRNYYDGIKSEQTNTYQPILERLDEVLIRAALGNRPEEIYYDWRPLWQMAEPERADVNLKKAQAFQIDAMMGVADPEVLAEARRNQLVEDGVYPGLEGLIDEAEAKEPDEEIDENDPDAVAQFEQSKAGPTGKPTLGGAPGAEVPQDTALNGAQITALAGIIKSVANKEYPPETAIQLIMVGFPTIKETAAKAMINPLENFEPPPKVNPLAPPGTPGAPDPNNPGKPVPPKSPQPPDPEEQ